MIRLDKGGRQFDQEGNRMDVIAFLNESDDSLELTDIVLDGAATMMSAASNLGVFFALQPLLDDERPMANRPAHILNYRAQRQDDSFPTQRFQIPRQCPLTTVKQSVGQIFYGKHVLS